MAQWIDDDPKVICHSDRSSRDSIEPIRSQVSKHPPGNGSLILCKELPLYFANGPALVSLKIMQEALLGKMFTPRRAYLSNFGG